MSWGGGRLADIFVSYTRSDREDAEWIGRELEALKHVPHLHDWEINAGEDVFSWMETRHGEADYLLAVVSAEYLQAPYSRLELNAALWQAFARRPGFVLLVVVKPCALPSLIEPMRRCEIVGLAEETRRVRLHDFMQRLAARDAEQIAPLNIAISNIPLRLPAHFIGREAEAQVIEAAFGDKRGRLAIAVLHGMPGVGKTTLAAAYAERQRMIRRAVWWIRAQVGASMCADIAELGAKLEWVASGEEEEPAAFAVLDRLRREGDGVFLVYDNANDADELRRFLPMSGGARILVTSNRPDWRGIAETIDVQTWSEEIGSLYLVMRSGQENERKSARGLSRALGGLPLAHEQAAAYCEKKGVSLADYLRRFEKNSERMLGRPEDAPREHNDGQTVATAFRLAIGEANRDHPAAERLIGFASLLAPDPVPLFLFTEACSVFAADLGGDYDEEGLDDIVAALRAFALVARKPLADDQYPDLSTDTIEVHRLVREIVRARIEPAELDRMRRALATALSTVYPRPGATNREQKRLEKRQLLPHVLAAVGFLRADRNDESEERELLDSMQRLAVMTLQDAASRSISAEYLPAVLADFYEVQPLCEAIKRLLANTATWPKIQEELLHANNFVLRYAMAEAIADEWPLQNIRAVIDEAADLNAFELGSYALGLAYARDPTLIDPAYLQRLAQHPAYPGRSILGDLVLNLALHDSDERPSDLRALLPDDRFWRPLWDFVALDVGMIRAAEGFFASPRVDPTGLDSAAAADYASLARAEQEIEDLSKRMIGEPAALLARYFRLGEDPMQIENAKDQLARLDDPTLRTFIRLMFAHPVWAVAEAAATALSELAEEDTARRPRRLSIVQDLLQDADWRVQFGANEAAYALRHVDPELFHGAVEKFFDHWNCKIRGLAAENLTADILNAGPKRRTALLARHAPQIKAWLRDEDCWVLEHVYRLFSTLEARHVAFADLLEEGVSRLFADAPGWYALDREAFLVHIEARKAALARSS